MKTNSIIAALALAVTAVAGVATFNTMNSEEFQAQTAFKSYSYAESFKVVSQFTNEYTNTIALATETIIR